MRETRSARKGEPQWEIIDET